MSHFIKTPLSILNKDVILFYPIWLDVIIDYKPMVILTKVVIFLSNLTRCSILHIVK
jgi:hypothetical protein